EEIAAKAGGRAAADFAEVARGISTPLDHHADAFLSYKAGYGMGAQKDFRRVLKWMEEWCNAAHEGSYLEDFDRRTAGRFIDESLTKGRSRDKASAYLSFLREYW